MLHLFPETKLSAHTPPELLTPCWLILITAPGDLTSLLSFLWLKIVMGALSHQKQLKAGMALPLPQTQKAFYDYNREAVCSCTFINPVTRGLGEPQRSQKVAAKSPWEEKMVKGGYGGSADPRHRDTLGAPLLWDP